GFGDAVEQGADGDRSAAAAVLLLGGLRVAGALAVPGAVPGQQDVQPHIDHCTRAEASRRRGRPALLQGVGDQFEAEGGDPNARRPATTTLGRCTRNAIALPSSSAPPATSPASRARIPGAMSPPLSSAADDAAASPRARATAAVFIPGRRSRRSPSQTP